MCSSQWLWCASRASAARSADEPLPDGDISGGLQSIEDELTLMENESTQMESELAQMGLNGTDTLKTARQYARGKCGRLRR
jgi:hypothetical protein